MTAALLGVRLALTPAGRLRGVAMVLAMVIAQVLLLGTAAACHALLLQGYDPADDTRLALACAAAITIPCAVLIVTVARLSAALRDRRLAGLRLIGLTPAQTRTVAAAETGVATVAGTAIGYVVFWLLRPALSGIHVAGLDWQAHFTPHPIDSVLALVVPPVLAVAAAVLPQRMRADEALASARRADRRPPRLWRVVPLALGMVICVMLQTGRPRALVGGTTDDTVPWFFAGMILLGVGILLVVPVFVRLVAALLLRLPVGAPTRLAARHLQAQPAGVARIVSVLLLGLFVVTGARYVLVDWEGQNYYRYAVDQLHHRQLASIPTTLGHAPALEAKARTVPGVTDVLVLPELRSAQGRTAVVAGCAEITRIEVPFGECQDGSAYDVDPWGRQPKQWTAAGRRSTRHTISVPTYHAMPERAGHIGDGTMGPLDQVSAVLPPKLIGSLPPSTQAELVVVAPPGRTLMSDLWTAGISDGGGYDFSQYDFVQRLKLLVWTIAGVILAVGLLAFGLATIDRAVQRRKETTGLRLVGIGAGALRRSQWVEATVPIGAGAVLAVVLGALGGATYLRWGEDTGHYPLPWQATWLLVGIAVTGAVLVGAATVVAGSPRIRPDEIRAE